MRRRAVVLFAVFGALLLLTATPASAASVASVNTTASDFSGATLDDMSVTGSGASASVTGDIGEEFSKTTGTEQESPTNLNDEGGLVFNVSQAHGVVFADTSATSEATVVYLRYQSNGTLINSVSTSTGSQTVPIEADLQPGVDYRLTADDDGATYTTSVHYTDAPDTSATISIVSGYRDGFSYPQANTYTFDGVGVGPAYDLRYQGDTHNADADTMFVNLSTSTGVTVQAQANSGSGWTTVSQTSVSTDQNVSLDISSSSATQYRAVVNASRELSTQTVTVHDEGVTFTASSPSLSNPDPADGADIGSFDGEISVDISDPDFGLAQGDSVTVVASDSGGQIGTETVSSNGTVSVEYTPVGGENNITWEASDSYGTTDATLSQDFEAPSRLEVRNETNGSELIDNVEVTLRFYREGNETVVTKTTSGGSVSLAGLPADEPFVATAEADGYVSRRIYVDSLLDQERIFLLNESVESVDVEFEIDDSTGSFSDASTVLTVQKAVTVDNDTEFRTVVGDRVGAAGALPTTLEKGERYRLVVSNGANTRSLGAYTATASGFRTLPIGEVILRGDFDEGWLIEGDITKQDSSPDILRVKFADKEAPATSVSTEVVRVNDTGAVVETVLENDTVSETQSVVRTVEVNNSSDTFLLRYSVERADGSTFGGERKIGSLSEIRVPVDPKWLNLMGWVGVFALGGLVTIKDSRAGAVVMAGSADLFALLSWIDAPVPVLALGTAAAVVWAAAGDGGGF